jgi:hypothetical protein
MYKTISNKIIREFKPCYDPSKFITDENEKLPIKNWVQKYRNIIPAKDIFWLLLRKEFISEKDLRLFAVWCAREALKLVENPDERSVEACNVAERYANGKATKEELLAAHAVAHDVADTAYLAVYAAYVASTATNTDYAVAHATLAAAHASDGVHDISDAAYHAAYAAYDAAYDVYFASDVAYAVRVAQIDQLLTYF